jgi:elongation factor G
MRFPDPVMSMAVEPQSQAERDRLNEALRALAEEDPTCVVSTDPDTGQTLLSGMGELHLEILKDRMLREFRVRPNAGKPTVAYRETVRSPGRGDHTFDREIGGNRQFGHVVVEVVPRERGAGNEIRFETAAAQIPANFRPSVEEGIRDGLVTGVLGSYAMVDVEVRVVGGGFDEQSSTDVAFHTAGVVAFREAARAAGPVLLEPIMSLEIIVPSLHLGDVLADLNARRGRVRNMSGKGEMQVIRASVPLAEMFGYSTAVRSLSKGRATYTMEPDFFDVIPEAIQKRLLDQ